MPLSARPSSITHALPLSMYFVLCRKNNTDNYYSSKLVSIRLHSHIRKQDQVLVTYTSTQLVMVQHANRNTTKAGLFFRIAVYHVVFTKDRFQVGQAPGAFERT
jgi:hypothetical protein